MNPSPISNEEPIINQDSNNPPLTITQNASSDRQKASLLLKMETDDERLKTDSDERLKTEERRLLRFEIESKQIPITKSQKSNKWKGFFNFLEPLMRRKTQEPPITDPNNSLGNSNKKPRKSFFLPKRRERTINKNLFNDPTMSTPTKERIKYLWGVARRKVYFAIKFVEGVSKVRDNRNKSILIGFDRQISREISHISKYIILPNNIYVKAYRIFLSFCFYYYVFIMPYRIAFNIANNYLLGVEIFLDALFFIEICLNFFCAYHDQVDNFVAEFPRIRRRYLRSYFFLDAIAMVPFYIFTWEYIFWFLIFKFLRFRFFILSMNLFENALLYIGFNTKSHRFMLTFAKIARLNLFLIVLIYFISCLWIRINGEEVTAKNVSQEKLDENLNYLNTESTLITAIYFYFTTLATVGFGDIFPTVLSERIYIIVLEFFGIGLFSYVLSQIIYHLNNYAASYENKLNEDREKLRDWIQKRDIVRSDYDNDFKPASKIENYFLFERKFNYKDMINGNQFYNKLTSKTEFKVLLRLYADFFEDFSGFFNFVASSKAKIQILKKLKPILINEKTYVIRKAKMPKGLYFLYHGKVHLIGKVGYNAKGFPFRKLNPGSFFGESLFLEEESKYDIVVHFKSHIKCLFWSKKSIAKFEMHFPKDYLNLKKMAFLRKKFYGQKLKQLDNYLESLVKLQEPRKTYLKLTSGDAIGDVQNRLRDKSLNSEIRSNFHFSMNSTDEKNPEKNITPANRPSIKKEKMPDVLINYENSAENAKKVTFIDADDKKQNTQHNTMFLMPPTLNNSPEIHLTSSKRLLHINNLTDIELMLRQFNNIQYDRNSETDDENHSDSELNDSLEIPIEENEPQFEVNNFEKIFSFLEKEIIKSEKMIENNLENFSNRFNLLLDETKRIEKHLE